VNGVEESGEIVTSKLSVFEVKASSEDGAH